MRKLVAKGTWAALVGVSMAHWSATGCEPACRLDGEVELCGSLVGLLGEVSAVPSTTDDGVFLKWPPVVLADGSMVFSSGWSLVRLGANGDTELLFDARAELSAPTVMEDGRLLVLSTGTQTWGAVVDPEVPGSATLINYLSHAQSPVAPFALGSARAYATLREHCAGVPVTLALSLPALSLIARLERSSPVKVLADGRLVMLRDANVVSEPWEYLASTSAGGDEEWRFEHPTGLIDFAPGPGGGLFVVTGGRELVQLTAIGATGWTYTPPCSDCNVIAAPTVTERGLYLIEARGYLPLDPCEILAGGDPQVVDELVALRPEGRERWRFDALDRVRSDALAPAGGATERLFPASRPAVATDGSLFVATDGAVVHVGRDGQELGSASYDRPSTSLLEIHDDGGFALGLHPTPLLTPDGTLVTWDGETLRLFRTRQRAARSGWIPPYGNLNNDSRAR
jgi:hypothetical protein